MCVAHHMSVAETALFQCLEVECVRLHHPLDWRASPRRAARRRPLIGRGSTRHERGGGDQGFACGQYEEQEIASVLDLVLPSDAPCRCHTFCWCPWLRITGCVPGCLEERGGGLLRAAVHWSPFLSSPLPLASAHHGEVHAPLCHECASCQYWSGGGGVRLAARVLGAGCWHQPWGAC